MKKSALTIIICLLIMVSCGEKKTAESSNDATVSVEEIEKLEASAEEAESLSKEIEQSARELDELLDNLENTDDQ